MSAPVVGRRYRIEADVVLQDDGCVPNTAWVRRTGDGPIFLTSDVVGLFTWTELDPPEPEYVVGGLYMDGAHHPTLWVREGYGWRQYGDRDGVPLAHLDLPIRPLTRLYREGEER